MNPVVIVVEGLSVDVRCLCHILHGDLVQVFFRKQLGKRAADGALGFQNAPVRLFFAHIKTSLVQFEFAVLLMLQNPIKCGILHTFVLFCPLKTHQVYYNIHMW